MLVVAVHEPLRESTDVSVVTEAAAAAGVLTRLEAGRRYGVGRVRAQLAAHRWQAPSPHIVVLHNGPVTDEQRMWVALLAAPRGAMLHGLSAAVASGLEGFTVDHLTLVIPGRSRNPSAGRLCLPPSWDVEVRWSVVLGPDDVNPLAVPPRTRPARSIVDAASERGPERRVRALVLAAVQQRLVSSRSLWDALSRRGRCRHRRMIVESIWDSEGGIQSLPEREFDALRRRARLPAPERQAALQSPSGRYFLDNDWPKLGMRVEVHGIPHLEIRNWDRDLARQNDVSIEGGGLLIFSSYAIRHEPTRVLDQLRRMARRRGWPG